MNRLVDYFIVVGFGDVLRPLKSTHSESHLYQASVTSRFPLADFIDAPLPDSMAMFCIPDGIKLTETPDLPIFYHFCNTVANGARLYGSCLRFFEPVSSEVFAGVDESEKEVTLDLNRSLVVSGNKGLRSLITNEEEDKGKNGQPQLYAAKCICLLSHWPFFDSFKAFLANLYQSSLTPTAICLERLLCNLINEVPLPPAGKLQVQYSVNGTNIFFKRPPPNNPLAFVDFKLNLVFELLDIELIVRIVECLLSERQILLVSSSFSALSIVGQSFLELIYPFQWEHIYIPFLPQAAIDIINAPMPFLMGTHSSFLDIATVPDSICLVNLDCNFLKLPVLPHASFASTPEQSHVTLPEKERGKLLERLLEHCPAKTKNPLKVISGIDFAFPNAPPPDEEFEEVHFANFDEFKVRSCFFRCFISIFRNYRDFLVLQSKSTLNTESYFNTSEFMRQNPASERFLHVFSQTVAFQKFIDDRIYVTPETESDVLYFDQSILAKLNRSFFARHNDTPFLCDQSFAINKTYIAMAPDASNQPAETFSYVQWPNLNLDLFSRSRLLISPFQNDAIRSQQAIFKHKKNAANLNSAPTKVLSRIVSDQIIYSLWFYLFGISLKKPASPTELISAYDVYARMRAEGFTIDEQIYKSILESCGKAGTPDLAFHILRDMQQSGIVPDATAYASIIATMDLNSHAVDQQETVAHMPISHIVESMRQVHARRATFDFKEANAFFTSRNMTPFSPESNDNSFFAIHSVSNKLSIRKSLSMPVAVQSDYFLSVFEIAFPKLTIQVADSCMECSRAILDHEIRVSWTSDSNDYTTMCPSCSCRFVARFSIRPKGSTDPNKVVVCEYLSPIVLRKEVENIVLREAPGFLLSAEFRRTSVTCFWNLAWHLSNLQLPLEGILIPNISAAVTPSAISSLKSPSHFYSPSPRR